MMSPIDPSRLACHRWNYYSRCTIQGHLSNVQLGSSEENVDVGSD